MAYAWNVSTANPELYALTYDEAFKLPEAQKHTETKSWTEKGDYTLAANETWRERLQPYRTHANQWASKIRSVCLHSNGVA